MSQLIKDIFLPERIGPNYLFSKYVVGIAIGKTGIIATKTHLKGKQTSIELTLEEKFEPLAAEETESERITRTLKVLFSKIGKYDEIHTIIPSSLVVFKELKLPFVTREKINLIIGFEIEPLLPFSLRDSVIDFIITRTIPEENSSELLVTAVQKQHIAEHLALFEAIGIQPDVIAVDTISLYGLYTSIPSYQQLPGGTALIDIGLYSTRITLMINSQLKMIRSLPKGIISIAKKAAHDLNTTPNEIMEKLIRFGFTTEDQADYNNSIEIAACSLWDDIDFTFTSFASQFLNRNPMTKIFILGDGTLVKGLQASFTQKIQIPCEEFHIEHPNESHITIKNDCIITPVNLVSVSAATPSPITIEYNLQDESFKKPNNSLLIKQLVVLITLTVSFFSLLATHYTIQTKKLTKEIKESQQEALVALKKTFKSLEDEKTLSDAIDAAEDEIAQQKETWFAFSSQSRGSFLQYLLEITSRIDTKSTGFEIEQLIFGENELILKGRVKDFDALKVLERELGQSPLFSFIEPQENLQFSMKITLARSSDDNS